MSANDADYSPFIVSLSTHERACSAVVVVRSFDKLRMNRAHHELETQRRLGGTSAR
jgi:hypothetical protein